MPQRLESGLEQLFVREVRRAGGLTYKLAPTHVGMPDRLVLLPHGVVLFAELKTDTGAVRPAQRELHQRWAELGTPVAVLAGRQAILTWCASLSLL